MNIHMQDTHNFLLIAIPTINETQSQENIQIEDQIVNLHNNPYCTAIFAGAPRLVGTPVQFRFQTKDTQYRL
jgi:hypothetical protein